MKLDNKIFFLFHSVGLKFNLLVSKFKEYFHFDIYLIKPILNGFEPFRDKFAIRNFFEFIHEVGLILFYVFIT